jgi:penicillin amidase
MARTKFYTVFFLLCALLCRGGEASKSERPIPVGERLSLSGLREPVEIIRDRWGISHIYARNQPDLFFAQGFNVARDRLFQLEIWRRQATGTLAEILGPRALGRDIGSRLLRARVDMDTEMRHYHPDGEEIITSFVRGINAYIDLTRKDPSLLPLEFRLLDLIPGHWTPEVVVSRHNGLFRNASSEISLAQAVAALGAEKVRDLTDLHPGKPALILKPELDASLLTGDILALYSASRAPVRFTAEDIRVESERAPSLPGVRALPDPLPAILLPDSTPGSNNWVVGGRHTLTGAPIMANDPHRRQQTPSLRYWVHLNAPGWDVIGGGEPALPGVSIGHNRYGAWGLTIFSVDQEDLYVYDTHPEDPDRYLYRDSWEDMRIFHERVAVRGKTPVSVELKYTRHGPVLHQDQENHKAYALRAAWLEVGCAPYLASLRMDQARTWEEFREACSFSRTPSENMVWADREGNIGWQAVGIAPLRPAWDGLLPVPGDGSCEWEGYLPIRALPHVFNPDEGYFSTANEDNLPPGYPYPVGFQWATPFRQARILEVLGSGRKFTRSDMMQLQHDVVSLPARTLVPLLRGLRGSGAAVQEALDSLGEWDFRMAPDSRAAAVYQSWQRRLTELVRTVSLSGPGHESAPRPPLTRMIAWLLSPDGRFGEDPLRGRDALLLRALEEAVGDLTSRLGPDMQGWRYGQEKFHHIRIRHLMSDAVRPELRARLDIGPRPRGGNGDTVNQTSGGYNQTSGASFRIIADLSDWDLTLGTNSPGQSGDPESPHYRDLFEIWSQDGYFPVFFTRKKIETVTESVTILGPETPAPEK